MNYQTFLQYFITTVNIYKKKSAKQKIVALILTVKIKRLKYHVIILF